MKLKKLFKTKLKFLTYNVQDLFLFLDQYQGQSLDHINEKQWSAYSSSLKRNKSLEKILGIQKVIVDTDPDVILFIEVGGKESLENFNQYFLKNKYSVYIQPTNSKRGIDIGYLLKPKFKAKISSHRKVKLENHTRFSRDIPELRIYHKNKLKMIILGVHFKSKLDLEKTDFEGRVQRENEIKGLKSIFLSLRKSVHHIPIVLAGDFNGIIQKEGREPEFNPLMDNTSLEDILELTNTTLENRFTYLYFGARPEPTANQIDYILIEEKYKDHLINEYCFVYRYKNTFGDIIKVDRLKEKLDLPSDHFPIMMGIYI
jgi:hypothetical protein